MEVVDIVITNTSTKRQNTFLGKFFTVLSTQIYHIKVYTAVDLFIVSKRYSQFLSLHTQLRKTLNESSNLPQFPGKTLFPMSSKIIENRKSLLGIWLQSLIKRNICKGLIHRFLKVHKHTASNSISPDEAIVLKFLTNIAQDPHRKTAFLDNFENEFFVRRREISIETTESLLILLISLCTDHKCWSKPMDILSKLMNRDFSKFYEKTQEVFVGLSSEVLRQVKFNLYLKKEINPDCQAKAYQLLQLVQGNNFEDRVILREIVRDIQLNHDEEAIGIYEKWGACELISPQKHIRSQMISLVNTKELNLEYVIQEKALIVTGCFETRTKLSRLFNLITVPDYRKEWDLRLEDMFEFEDGHRMTYLSDTKVYTFNTTMGVTESDTSFVSKTIGFMIDDQDSQIEIAFTAEKVRGNDDEEFEEFDKVRVSWNYELKGKASRIVIYDIVGEESLMQKSFENLFQCCQKDFEFLGIVKKRVSISEAVSSKRLSYRMVKSHN